MTLNKTFRNCESAIYGSIVRNAVNFGGTGSGLGALLQPIKKKWWSSGENVRGLGAVPSGWKCSVLVRAVARWRGRSGARGPRGALRGRARVLRGRGWRAMSTMPAVAGRTTVRGSCVPSSRTALRFMSAYSVC